MAPYLSRVMKNSDLDSGTYVVLAAGPAGPVINNNDPMQVVVVDPGWSSNQKMMAAFGGTALVIAVVVGRKKIWTFTLTLGKYVLDKVRMLYRTGNNTSAENNTGPDPVRVPVDTPSIQALPPALLVAERNPWAVDGWDLEAVYAVQDRAMEREFI